MPARCFAGWGSPIWGGRLLVLTRNFAHNADTFAFAHLRGPMKPTSRHLVAFGAAALVCLSATASLHADDTKAAPAKPAGEKSAPDKGAVGSGWSQEVAPANGTTGIALDERQTEVIKSVSGYFGKLENLKGNFVQTGADKKRMRGKFFVKRPGRFRFDYALPSKQVIVSDGEYLAVQDLDINTEDRVALDQTAFRLLLRKDVDLLRDARITEVQTADDLIVVALQDKSPDAPGRIKLFFATKPEMELKEWVTTDAQGLETRVEVSDLNKTDQLDPAMFKIQMLGPRKNVP